MPKAGKSYDIPASGGHVHLTSTGIGDPKTATMPAGAVACFISAKTGAARVTVDGSVPSATNGLVVPAGALPLWLPVEAAVGYAGDGVAGELDVLYLL